jgi:hypothetical protein
MGYALGPYRVEFLKLNSDAPSMWTASYSSNEPTEAYFQELAATYLGQYWTAELEPVASGLPPIPEVVRISAPDGTEIYRWSIADMLAATQSGNRAPQHA